MDINPHAPLVARKDLLIEASPEVVWAIQADIDGWKDWQPDISKSRLEGPVQVDSRFEWTSGGFAVTSTVQEVEPQRRIAWTGRALGSRARHIWTFTPQQGGTLVTTEESLDGWLMVILKLFMPKFLDHSLEVWIHSLKNKAEGRPTK